MSRRPLAGIRVLVGRARHQASVLSAALRKQGAEVLEIPFIEIRKPRSFRSLDQALKNLNSYDWLILTSVNGVEAMWERIEKLKLKNALATDKLGRGTSSTRAVKPAKGSPALAAEASPLIAAIGPATKRAIEQRGATVEVVPEEYIAESVVKSLKHRVNGKRVLLVRAKVARDVIPRELRKAGAKVDVVEAYETVIPKKSAAALQKALKNSPQTPDVITFTSSSTVRNFVNLLGGSRKTLKTLHATGRLHLASIGPVTSFTLRELKMPVDIEANEYTIPGLVKAVVKAKFAGRKIVDQ